MPAIRDRSPLEPFCYFFIFFVKVTNTDFQKKCRNLGFVTFICTPNTYIFMKFPDISPSAKWILIQLEFRCRVVKFSRHVNMEYTYRAEEFCRPTVDDKSRQMKREKEILDKNLTEFFIFILILIFFRHFHRHSCSPHVSIPNDHNHI